MMVFRFWACPLRVVALLLSAAPQLKAGWITSKENQYFSKSYVNRLGGYLLGTGMIEPIDDILG